MTGRKKTLKSLSALVIAGFAVLSLSGCYFVDGTVRMTERDGDLIVDVQVTQGVETDLFATPEDAYDYLIQRYSAPDWGYGGTGDSSPFTFIKMRNSFRVDNTQNSTGSITDGHGSNIYIVYTEENGRPEFQVGFNMDLPTPPAGSNVEQQVTFDLVPPAGWTMERFPAATTDIGGQSSLAWYGVGGGRQPSVTFRLFPPYTPPVTGEPVYVEPAEPAPEEEAEPAPTPSEEQPAEPSDTNGAPSQPNSTNEEETSSSEARAEAETSDSDGLDEEPEAAEQANTDIIGQGGRATTEVSGAPGLVKIGSELFPAIAMNNQVIPAGSQVEVIGVFTDGVIVEALNSVESPSIGWLIGGSVTALAAIAAVIFAVLRKKQKDKAPDTEAAEAS